MRNRVVLGSLVAAGLAASACQPMYGSPPQHLAKLEVKPVKAVPVADVPIVYVEDCTFDFHSRPPKKQRTADPAAIAAADQHVQHVDLAQPEPVVEAELTRAIGDYAHALAGDPYDPAATLGLALAYDRVHHKGCALALLKRLGALADHPAFASAARPVAESVGYHDAWFKGYRKEALAAVGGP